VSTFQSSAVRGAANSSKHRRNSVTHPGRGDGNIPGSASSADGTAKDTRPTGLEPAAPPTRPSATEHSVMLESNKGHQASEPVRREGRNPNADEDGAQPLQEAVPSSAEADRESEIVSCCRGSLKSSCTLEITQSDGLEILRGKSVI
jgi:hypothetical protein